MRRLFLLLSLAACAFAQSEKFNHVQWTMTPFAGSALPGSTVVAHLEAVVDDGWHMYSLTTPPGPIPTTIKTLNGAGIAKVTFFEPPPIRKYDENFQADTETYEGAQVFLARIELKSPPRWVISRSRSNLATRRAAALNAFRRARAILARFCVLSPKYRSNADNTIPASYP